jgi:hypothetical protein
MAVNRSQQDELTKSRESSILATSDLYRGAGAPDEPSPRIVFPENEQMVLLYVAITKTLHATPQRRMSIFDHSPPGQGRQVAPLRAVITPQTRTRLVR